MLYNKLKLTNIPEPVFAHVYSCPGYESKFKVMVPNLEIAYIKLGELNLQIYGKEFIAKERSFLILPHNHEFSIKETNNAPHIHYTISAMVDPQSTLSEELTGAEGEKELVLPIIIEESKTTENCEKLLYDAINEYQKNDDISKLKCGSLVAELLCELSKSSFAAPDLKHSSKAEIIDSRIKKYIEKNIRTKILLTDIADALGKNANYLNQVFTKKNNMSIISYANLVKMKKAAVLIVDKGLSVKEAAKEVGINDVNYLSRLFKQKMGMTVSQYKSTSADYTFSLADKEKIKGM